MDCASWDADWGLATFPIDSFGRRRGHWLGGIYQQHRHRRLIAASGFSDCYYAESAAIATNHSRRPRGELRIHASYIHPAQYDRLWHREGAAFLHGANRTFDESDGMCHSVGVAYLAGPLSKLGGLMADRHILRAFLEMNHLSSMDCLR